MAVDREALAAALAQLPAISGTATDRHSIPADRLLIVATAARERLAQLPEQCGTCRGAGVLPGKGTERYTAMTTCPTCNGSGKVYPAETVERIFGLIYEAFGWEDAPECRDLAVAVLDALNGELADR